MSTNKSRRTVVESMRRIARCLGVQLDAQDHEAWRRIPWLSLTYAETNMVRAQLVAQAKPATVRLTLAVLKRVLRSAYRLRLIEAEQYQRAIDLDPVPGKSARKGRELKAEDVAQLEQHFATLEEPYRQMVRAIFAVGLGAGLRREELCRLALEGVQGELLVFMGKRLKEARQPIEAWARAVLEEWLVARKALRFQTPTVFVRYDFAGEVLLDEPMTPTTVWETVAREAKAAGVTMSTHDLRRTFGTRIIRKDILHAKTLLRHENLATTELYDRRAEDGARELLGTLEPMMAPAAPVKIAPKVTERWLAFVAFVKRRLKGDANPLDANANVVIGFLRERRAAGSSARELASDANEIVQQLQAARTWWTPKWIAEVQKELR